MVVKIYLKVLVSNQFLVLFPGPYYYKTTPRTRREEEYYYAGGSSLDQPRSVRASKYQISRVPGP